MARKSSLDMKDLNFKVYPPTYEAFELICSTGGFKSKRVNVPQAGLFEFMADTRNTLAQVMDRLEAQERATEAQARKVAQHDRDIEQLKRAAGLK